MNLRYAMLVASLWCVAIALVARLVFVQHVDADRHVERAQSRLIKEDYVPATRGAIFDRNGVPLVTSEPAYHLSLRVGYFWRGSAVGGVQSTLEAVRAAMSEREDESDPAGRILVSEVIEDPGSFVDALLDRCRKRDILRIPSRRYRWEIYERLTRLFDLPSRGALVRRLNAAADDATIAEVLLGGARPLHADPHELGRIKIAAERERFGDLAIRIGVSLPELLASIDSRIATVERGVVRRIGRLVERARKSDPEFDPHSARRVAEREARADVPYRLWRLVSGIDQLTALSLFLEEDDYPGFEVEENHRRVTTPGAPYHVLGRVRPLRPEEVEDAIDASRDEGPVAPIEPGPQRAWAWRRHVASLRGEIDSIETTIGADGLEAALDDVLRGRPGHVRARRDHRGRIVEILESSSPVAGCDVTLTIDLELQSELENILDEGLGDGEAGCAILMDAKTGAIYAMASRPSPSWDVNDDEIVARYEDPAQSLVDRCIRRPPFPYPGSTFKIVSAVAALEEGLVDERTTYRCYHCLDPRYPDRFRCLGRHADVALHRAMKKSCNVYFYHVGEALGGRVLEDWSRRFGIGELGGIELAEDPGRIYSPRTKSPWGAGDARKFAIGQVNVEVTPLQILRMTVAIGNGGTLVRPHVVASGGGSDTWRAGTAERIEMRPSTIRIVADSLRSVVGEAGGTAYDFGLDAFSAAGKTGTAETYEEGPTHAWFVGYAPHANPDVGVIVYRELCDLHGGDGSAPMAARALAAFYARDPRRP